jgi:hypothetical protein
MKDLKHVSLAASCLGSSAIVWAVADGYMSLAHAIILLHVFALCVYVILTD